MIYFEESLNLLTMIFDANDIVSYDFLVDKSGLKEEEIKQILSFLLLNGSIDVKGNYYALTKQGERFYKSFSEYEDETLTILENLRTVYPQTLTKRDCSHNLSTAVFRDIYYYLKEKKYIDAVPTTTGHELVRLGELGFVILDYFEMKSKLNKIID